jgi:hypothetical protein
MSELNSIPSTTPIPDDTRLVGQRPANQGGAAVGMSVAELTEKIVGAAGGTFSRDNIVARKTLQGVPATNGVDEFIGLHPYFEGTPVVAHAVDGWSGIPNRFASQADHFHYKLAIRSVAAGSAAERAQLMYTARQDGTSSINLFGHEAEIGSVELQSEHSIDTTATTVSGSPSFTGTVKVRYTVAHGLSLNQRVLFRVTSAVAGIQASFFSAIVTQAPTLVSGVYEVLLQVSGLDGNHWDAAKAANTAAQNADWRVLTLTAGAINDANKVSLARDTTGPSDQVLITWSTTHGLLAGANVVLWTDGALTGLTGFWAGFHSGYVVEVPSTTQVRVRFRNQRVQGIDNLAGTATSAVSTWYLFAGTLDPHHEPLPSANALMAQRDAAGRTRRLALGESDVWVDDEWAIGVGGLDNTLRARRGELLMGRHSLRAMIGARSPMGGVRALNDGVAAGAITTVTFGPTLGTGLYTVVAIVQMPPAAPPADRGIFLLNPDVGLHGLFLSDGGNFSINVGGSSAGVSAAPWYGQVVVLEMRRTTTAVELYVNGTLVITHFGTGWDNTLQSTTQLRVGGAYTAGQRYNDVVYRAWLFPHLLTAADRDFILVHGRIPSELQWGGATATYTSSFTSAADSWVQNMGNAALTTTGNIDSVSGVDDTLRVTNTAGSALNMQLTRASTLVVGKRYRVALDYFAETGSGMAFLGLGFHGTKMNTNDNVAIVENSWQTGRTFEFVATQTAMFLCIFTTAAGSSGGFIAAGKNLWLKNIAITRLGPTVAHDFSVGVGNQVHDQSGNGYHATLFAPFDHVVPTRTGQVRQRVSASGNTQIFAGIPVNARIRWVTANAAGSVTLSIGNVSAGTQIVNAQALSAGRQDVGTSGAFSTTGALWVNLSSAVQVDLTIHFELAD